MDGSRERGEQEKRKGWEDGLWTCHTWETFKKAAAALPLGYTRRTSFVRICNCSMTCIERWSRVEKTEEVRMIICV